MYEKVDGNFDFVEKELKTIKFWKENNIFELSVSQREKGKNFTFYDGPPTANGKPHIGHILTRVVKDVIPRYKTMKGYKVCRKAGWDTHGLPVELEVEKELGISGKSQIEKYGIKEFIQKCKDSVFKYKEDWRYMSERVGYWADMDSPYVTYDNDYIESVWWAIKTIWDKGLLYNGHRVVPYCPRCETTLSSHEVAQGYKLVKEDSIYVKFKLKGAEKEYFLVWTTTPWTLPSNVALVVNGELEYVKAKMGKDIYILAKDLVKEVIGDDAEIINTFKGKDLKGKHYEPIFDFYKTYKECYYVVCDDYVSVKDGTGIVHNAPAFGEEDARIGKEYDLPFVQLVNEQGRFEEEAIPFKGLFVKDADKIVIRELDQRHLIYKILDYEHSYPFCWRCDTPLIYYSRRSWFIEMSKLRNDLMENNKNINWYPINIQTGRFGNFLENVIDWSISRERYWGTPLPVWQCACGEIEVIGSKEELFNKVKCVIHDIDLHRPYIDEIIFTCKNCEGEMRRVTEVIDCWFDSGSMPFAQWHYPFENEKIFKDNFPADFISEAVDQTRGWFYTLTAISTIMFQQEAFKNVIVLGHVQDKNGLKMSKHKGNVVDPFKILDEQGADAVRWYFLTSSALWLPSRFYSEAVIDVQRRFMGTLQNIYAFYVLYANIDKFNPKDNKIENDKSNLMDKWLYSKINTLIQYVDESVEAYRLTDSARAISGFVIDDLSNWYVRRCRERFWATGMDQDKLSAYVTLHTVLIQLVKLIAPFVPFISESIYQNIVRSIDKDAPISVHLCDYPKVNLKYIDKELEQDMDLVKDIVNEGRVARNNAKIKNRQPIKSLFIKSNKNLRDDCVNIIKDELNIKEIIMVDDIDSFTEYSVKPQLKVLGPKYGKMLSDISQHLQHIDSKELIKSIQDIGSIKVKVRDSEIILTEEDLLIKAVSKNNYIVQEGNGITVILDINLDKGLIDEGLARELISKIQTMRKEAGFDVMDKIIVSYVTDDDIIDNVLNNMSYISKEVLADAIYKSNLDGYIKEWDINGYKVILSVKKID